MRDSWFAPISLLLPTPEEDEFQETLAVDLEHRFRILLLDYVTTLGQLPEGLEADFEAGVD